MNVFQTYESNMSYTRVSLRERRGVFGGVFGGGVCGLTVDSGQSLLEIETK